MIDFAEFAAKHRALDRETFLRRVTTPFLFTAHQLAEDATVSGFATLRITPGEGLRRFGRGALAAVKKRAGRASSFGVTITLGRAPNNDVVIPDPQVSKMHAFFQHSGGVWTITDAGSANGTFVNGVPADKRSGSTRVRPGARIRIGPTLELTFYDPEMLYGKVRSAR